MSAADTTGAVGAGVFDSGDFGAWADPNYTSSLADWAANEDTSWNNNLYFNNPVSPNDRTSSAANGEPANVTRAYTALSLGGTPTCFPIYGASGYSKATLPASVDNNFSSHTTGSATC